MSGFVDNECMSSMAARVAGVGSSLSTEGAPPWPHMQSVL
ncbi:hypothetical protein BN2497_9997 [Janthinobacterium sp. CG23_2]|nr:hypothetical protein BN2497_9997 [Janthinobacterium sp. CG23_2]CUU31396.1 hypothetical protein BN3177_9997 [Janthinobacterium sp. CG23_2]